MPNPLCNSKPTILLSYLGKGLKIPNPNCSPNPNPNPNPSIVKGYLDDGLKVFVDYLRTVLKAEANNDFEQIMASFQAYPSILMILSGL